MKWAWSVARSTCGNLHGTVWLSNAGNTIFTTSLPQNKRTKASKYAVERTPGTPVNNEMGVERRSTCGDLHGTAVVEQLKQYSVSNTTSLPQNTRERKHQIKISYFFSSVVWFPLPHMTYILLVHTYNIHIYFCSSEPHSKKQINTSQHQSINPTK